ncbi:TetR/AcrR family transcriptional regulator [Nocardia coubleae]|nr:TetR/AcrR family transcriptional regulator [Nocardia coubleae]
MADGNRAEKTMASVTRKTQSRRQDRRVEWTQRFLAATEQLMREGHAYTDLSVDKLAGAAGTSRATFYVHFEDKGDLLRGLATHVLADIEFAARSWWQSEQLHDADALLAATTAIVAVYRDHQFLISAVIEAAAYDERVSDDYTTMINSISDATRQVIDRGQSAGTIRALPAETVAGALTWMVERVCHQMVRVTPPENDSVIARSLAEIIWSALYLESLFDDQ